MAQFLTTAGVASGIENIIIEARKELVLLTPFLQLSRHAEERLKDANNRKVNITIIYGKSELSPTQQKKLDCLQYLTLCYCSNLHAKCYHNGENMIIASMNLYEFSEKNNREMGIALHRKEDASIFRKALAEIASIKDVADVRKQNEMIPHITDEYSSVTNFHIPLMDAKLRYQFKEMNFRLAENTIVASFDHSKTELNIDYRIILKFNSQYYCDKLKAILPPKALGTLRPFWNNKTLHLYLPKEHNSEISTANQTAIVKSFLSFISQAWDYLVYL